MSGKARSAATSPSLTSSAAYVKLHGEKASSAGRTSRSGAEAAPCGDGPFIRDSVRGARGRRKRGAAIHTATPIT